MISRFGCKHVEQTFTIVRVMPNTPSIVGYMYCEDNIDDRCADIEALLHFGIPHEVEHLEPF